MSVIVAWDGEGDYVYPCKPGDWISAARDGVLVVGRVVRTQGYGPDVVELHHHNIGFDLVGWDVTVLPTTDRNSSTPIPDKEHQ